MKKILKFMFIFLLCFNFLFAWGPHPEITRAALEVLPEYNKWEMAFGKENITQLSTQYCWIPDIAYQDTGKFFVNDYIIFKTLPVTVFHIYPDIKKGLEEQFKRTIQAFKTENYREFFRYLGALIHYIEDIGAPPHAIPVIGFPHAEMENWVKSSLINIKEYTPKILGDKEEEIYYNFMKEMENLREFGKSIGEKTLPLAKEGKREEVENLTLLAAKKCAEVVSDWLYTIFKLPENFERNKVIEGQIIFPYIRFHESKGAKVILIDNKKYKELKDEVSEEELLFESTTSYTTFTDEKGNFEFFNIPEGEYRVLSYKVGCKLAISEPFEVKTGNIQNVFLSLSPTDPPNNLILNPDCKLYHCYKTLPDYWRVCKNDWPDYYKKPGNFYASHPIKLNPNTEYKIGAKLRDKNTKIFMSISNELTNWGKAVETEIKDGEEISYISDKAVYFKIIVETFFPLQYAIKNVYIVPKQSQK